LAIVGRRIRGAVTARHCPRAQHRFSWQRAEFARDFDSARRHARGLAKLIDQSHAQRSRRIDQCSSREQLRGMPSHQAPEGAVNRSARKQTHLHFVEPETEFALRHHAVVTVDGEHRPAGRTVTGNREHDRNG